MAGVTGWAGAPLSRAVEAAPDLQLVGGVARRGADFSSVADALAEVEADVLVDYTSAAVVRPNVDAALASGLHVVVGSSGLTEADYVELDAVALAAGRAVIAAGNFSVLAATLLHAASVAAEHVEHWEIVDYGSAGKPDAPSGTSHELAERLATVHEPAPAEHDAEVIGRPEGAGGASIKGNRGALRAPRPRVGRSLRRRNDAGNPSHAAGHRRPARSRPAAVRSIAPAPVKKGTPTMQKNPSQLIDARVKELGDWRGEKLARIRLSSSRPTPKLSRSGSGEGFRCGRTPE